MENNSRVDVDNSMQKFKNSIKSELNDGEDCKYETNEKAVYSMHVNAAQCPAVRKDTKDSGFGDAVSERDEEHELLPDWCRECKDACENSDEEKTHNTLNIENNNRNDGAYNDDHDDKRHDRPTCTNIIEKPTKRHRRITPVPLSTPVKLCLGTSPDYLFVEEEDAEDINSFNCENDYLDQGFIGQTCDSPNWRRKAYQRRTNAASSKDDEKADSLSTDPTKMLFRSKSENAAEYLASSHQTKKSDNAFGSIWCTGTTQLETLPDWMKDAKEESTKKDSRLNQSWDSIYRNEGENRQQENRAGSNEESIRIHVPHLDEHEQVKKVSRNRKLTPVQTAGPSLDKIRDLQDQAVALSLSEEPDNDEN